MPRTSFPDSQECDRFKGALRLYYTKREVLDYNHKQLRDLGLPVKKIKAVHTGVGAAKADSDVAEGLHAEVDMARCESHVDEEPVGRSGPCLLVSLQCPLVHLLGLSSLPWSA